ncbi:MAG TPA: hypothetical protein VN688_33385 [Gemmataceae bacterium]|nr:hypothetical protein [Gemmataceae bacterium]
MATLIYNGVRLNIVSTEYISFKQVPTEDGVDAIYTEFEIAVTAWFNPAATASAGPGKQAREGGFPANLTDAPNPGQPGDQLGDSLVNLRQMLSPNRRQLTYLVGGKVVVSSPPGAVLNPGGENPAVAAGVDARYGPIVKGLKVTKIAGDKSARVYFHVVTWLQDFVPDKSTATRIVLANRYTTSSSMDEDYWSVRHVQGQMQVDANQLQFSGLLTPDAFRQAAFLPIPPGFKRDGVEVTVSSDNTTLDYSFVDTETKLALGLRSMATRIEGNCTAGSESPIANLRAVAKGARASANMGMAWGMALLDPLGLVGPGIKGLFDATGAAMDSILPQLKANGIVRIWGQRDARKEDLMKLGVNILFDRFAPMNGGVLGIGNKPPRFVSLYCTQDLSERFIEVRAEFFAPIGVVGWSLVNPPNQNIPKMMSLETNIVGGAEAGTENTLKGDGTGNSPMPPGGGGTRGNWLGAMVAALLSQPGTLPQLPAAANVVDQPAFQ